MNAENLMVRRAQMEDIPLLMDLIKGLASYEKRPQDVTGTEEQLRCWLFERKIATALIAEYAGETVGYAIYYPAFGSFAAIGKVHLEDFFIRPDFRGFGLGRAFLAQTAKMVLADGYTEMEWSCLAWNKPSIAFYKKLGAAQETGREYFGFTRSELESMAEHY